MRRTRRAVLASTGAAAALGGCLSPGLLGGRRVRVHSELDDAHGNWTTYAGGHRNRGYARIENDHSEASIAWQGNYGTTTESQPVVYDDRVFASRENSVLCLTVEDGTVEWEYEVDSPATPTIYDDELYVGELSGYHAVTLDGERRWHTELYKEAHTCPTVTPDHVYASALYRNFRKLRREDGAVLQETPEEAPRDLYSPKISSPILEPSRIVVEAVRSPGIRSVSKDDLSEQWQLNGNPRSTLVADSSQMYITDADYLEAVNKNTRERRWGHRVGWPARVDFFPAVTDEMVYIGGRSGIQAFDKRSGEMQWVYETGHERFSSVTADENTVYCGTVKELRHRRESRLLALDRRSGTLRWEIGLDSGAVSPPAVVDNAVFVECASGSLYAISLR